MLRRPIAATLTVASITFASVSNTAVAVADVIEDCAGAYAPTDALAACSEIIASDWASEKQLVIAHNNRANANDYLGRPEVAIEDYSRALAYDPHSVNALYNRGTTFLALKNIPRAIADFNAVLKLKPGRADALNNRGLALLERGDLDAAIDDFMAAIRLETSFAFAYNNRGVAWRRKGDSKRAISDFTSALEIRPDYVGALNSRGEVHRAVGDVEAALNDFRLALAVDPAHAAAKRNLESMIKPESRFQTIRLPYE